jgi:hypothetical protein
VATDLRKELDAFIKASTEQLPEWHEAMVSPGDFLSLEQTIKIHSGLLKVYREAILRLADEVDRLEAAD